jgi:hypothetical protein
MKVRRGGALRPRDRALSSSPHLIPGVLNLSLARSAARAGEEERLSRVCSGLAILLHSPVDGRRQTTTTDTVDSPRALRPCVKDATPHDGVRLAGPPPDSKRQGCDAATCSRRRIGRAGSGWVVVVRWMAVVI